MTDQRGRFLLLGSGEFEPWAAAAERFALSEATGDGSVAVLATASGREGEAVFEGWTNRGLTHYESLDIRAHAVRVRTRVDALNASVAKPLDDASMVSSAAEVQSTSRKRSQGRLCGTVCGGSSIEVACSPDAVRAR